MRFFLSLFSFLLALSSVAQKGHLSGKIVDEEYDVIDTPLPDEIVELHQNNNNL